MKRLAIIAFAEVLCALSTRGQHNPFIPKRTVLPITTVKMDVGLGVGPEFNLGTGFCLDVRCKFVITNYHVAIRTGRSPGSEEREQSRGTWIRDRMMKVQL